VKCIIVTISRQLLVLLRLLVGHLSETATVRRFESNGSYFGTDGQIISFSVGSFSIDDDGRQQTTDNRQQHHLVICIPFPLISPQIMPDNTASLVVPLRRWKRSERTTLDSDPILWKEPSTSSTSSSANHHNAQETETTQSRCTVCRQNLSRYTCPRCQIPYCSVDCYRNHTTENSEDVSACTEAFYQNRVQSIRQLETLEHNEDTHKVLNRQYEQSLVSEDEDVSAEELYTLLSALEEQQGDDSMTQEQLLSLLSPTLRATFQKDLQNGSLQKLVLETWYPWWRRELGNVEDDGDNDESPTTIQEPQTTRTSTKTLDERLLQIPSFDFIRKSGPAPLLVFNAIDIVYSICWTLRLYHGANNAASQLPVDAAAALVSNSKVLNQDTRYNHLEQVLGDSTTASTQQYPVGCNVHWTVLTTDCSLVLASYRLVGRALLEAIDILKAAMKQMKQLKQQESSSSSDAKEQVSQLRRVRKKLEYFLSWSKQSSELGEDIRNAIQEWSESWRQDSESQDQEFMEELQFPAPAKEPPRNATNVVPSAPPLMTVVETKSRKK
jgi:gas vesicle protein